MKQSKRPISIENLRLKMAGLCSCSEQCEYDIRTKLFRAGLNTSDSEDIISFLKTEKFLDNKRYAKAYARDKAIFAGWGRKKIRMMLVSKKIASDTIDWALNQIDQDEYERQLMKATVSKGSGLDLSTREDNIRLYRHLLNRGYESSLIITSIKKFRES